MRIGDLTVVWASTASIQEILRYKLRAVVRANRSYLTQRPVFHTRCLQKKQFQKWNLNHNKGLYTILLLCAAKYK